MRLDLRTPLGLMFTLTGLILTLFGLSTNGNEVLYARSLGVNVNMWWGVVLLVFGLVMLELGRRGQKRAEAQARESAKDETARQGH